MPDVFTIDDGDVTIAPGELPEPMQLWWGTFRGEALGLLTEVHGYIPPDADGEVMAHLFHLSSVMGCLADDRMPPITGIGPRDQQVIPDEIVLEDWGRGTVVVDGSTVATSTLTYRGLDFAMGADLERHPFVLLRLAGGSPEWPPLGTTVIPDEGLTM